MSTHPKLRANWGTVAHIVPTGDSRTRPALCGYFPGAHATERAGFIHRCRWRNDAVTRTSRTCAACVRLAEGVVIK